MARHVTAKLGHLHPSTSLSSSSVDTAPLTASSGRRNTEEIHLPPGVTAPAGTELLQHKLQQLSQHDNVIGLSFDSLVADIAAASQQLNYEPSSRIPDLGSLPDFDRMLEEIESSPPPPPPPSAACDCDPFTRVWHQSQQPLPPSAVFPDVDWTELTAKYYDEQLASMAASCLDNTIDEDFSPVALIEFGGSPPAGWQSPPLSVDSDRSGSVITSWDCVVPDIKPPVELSVLRSWGPAGMTGSGIDDMVTLDDATWPDTSISSNSGEFN